MGKSKYLIRFSEKTSIKPAQRDENSVSFQGIVCFIHWNSETVNFPNNSKQNGKVFQLRFEEKNLHDICSWCKFKWKTYTNAQSTVFWIEIQKRKKKNNNSEAPIQRNESERRKINMKFWKIAKNRKQTTFTMWMAHAIIVVNRAAHIGINTVFRFPSHFLLFIYTYS